MYTNGEIIITLSNCTIIVESCKSDIVYRFSSKKEAIEKFIKLIALNA
ncbi:hypothetical protein [Carnobacterium divergens]